MCRTLVNELDLNFIKFGFILSDIRQVIFYDTEIPAIDFIKLAEKTVIPNFSYSSFRSLVFVMKNGCTIKKSFSPDVFDCYHCVDEVPKIKGIFKLFYDERDPKNLYDVKEALVDNSITAEQWQRQSNICN